MHSNDKLHYEVKHTLSMNLETAIIMELLIFSIPDRSKQKGSKATIRFTASACQVFTNEKIIYFQISLPVPWILFCYSLKSQEQMLFSSYNNSSN